MNSWKELDKALSNDAGRAQLNSTFKMCRYALHETIIIASFLDRSVDESICTYIYTHACRGSTVDAIPDLLDTAIVYSAMTDYPTESGFLTHLPAYPVKEVRIFNFSCRTFWNFD